MLDEQERRGQMQLEHVLHSMNAHVYKTRGNREVQNQQKTKWIWSKAIVKTENWARKEIFGRCDVILSEYNYMSSYESPHFNDVSAEWGTKKSKMFALQSMFQEFLIIYSMHHFIRFWWNLSAINLKI